MSTEKTNELSGSVAVVLVNWNNTADTLACLRHLRKVKQDHEVILVDNHSCQSEYEALKAKMDNEVLLRQKRNLGFAGGCNAGIRWALKHGFEYIWLLNNDTVVDPEALSELIHAMETNPRTGIAGGVMYHWHDPQRIQMAGGFIDPENGRGGMLGLDELDTGQFRGVFDVDYVSGGMLLVRSEAIREVGLLDERFFMYYEDTDWGVRMRKQNWHVITTSKAKVWHKDKASAGAKKSYFIQHGYLMFLYKNFRHNLPPAMRVYARHYLRPHIERHQWRLALEDARIYWNLFSRLAFVRPNIHS